MKDRVEMLTTKGVTLDDVMVRTNDIQKDCEDFLVKNVTNKTCYFNPNFNGLQFISDDGELNKMPLTPFSLSQLCGKMGVPTSYVRKLIDNGYGDLAAENVNAFLDDYHKDILIRGHNNSIRGILSSRYAMMDAPDIADVVMDTFGDSYLLKGMYISPERMHLRIVQKEMLNIMGEDLFAGITIDSSDVGRSTLSVRFFIYKQVCTNGMCISQDIGNIFTQRHIGLTKDEFYSELTGNISRIPLVTDSIMGLILQASSSGGSEVSYNKFDDSRRDRFVSRIRALTKLSEDSVEKVINTMYNSYSVTTWGFINSITEVAQDFTLERRIELEEFAGRLLMTPNLISV